MAAVDADGRLVEANAAMAVLAGRAAPPEAGEQAAPLLAAALARMTEIRDFPEAISGREARLLAAWGRPGGQPLEARAPDGTWWLLSSHSRGAGGRGFLAVDITAREETHALANRLLVENPVPIWAVEAETGRFAFANQAARALYGSARDGDEALQLIERFVMPRQRGQIEDSPECDRVDFVDALVETPDGRRLWTAGAAKRIAHRGKAFTACTLFDTTESNRADHEQARTLEVLSEAILSLDEGFALYDSEFRFVMGNKRLYEMFYSEIDPPVPGEPSHETIRRLVEAGFYEVPEGESRESFLARILAGVTQRPGNTEIHLADGRSFQRSIHTTRIGGYIVTFTETTHMHRAEQAEKEADRLVRTIVENSPTTFLVSRIDTGEIVYFPPASKERFGNITSAKSFFLDPKDREDYLAALLEAGALTDYPVRFRRGDGSVMQGLTSARVVNYKGEDVIISSTRDITETLAMQAELERQREIAHQNEKLSALGELLAGVSHELNNPLSIVVGYAQMLQDRLDDPKLRRRVDRIAQAAERCTKIVRTFLAMARKRPARVEACSLNEVLDMAIDVAGYGLRTAGAEIVRDFDDALPAIDADPDQLAQVFTNLIVNAEHAMSEMGSRGRLQLATYFDAETGEVVAEVSDNGRGMSRDIQARIFEPFFTTKEVGTGTGVGLAFCHRIVSAHGGRLTVQSETGRGASFVVALRVSERRAEPCEEAGAEPCTAAGRVLVVDDEPDVADMIAEVLEEAGYATRSCNRARAALDLLAEGERFDAVLSDIKMPDMGGAGFLDELERRHPALVERLGFVTGDTMSAEVEALLARSARPHLEKPLMPEALLALVSRLATAPEGEPA